MIEGFLWNGRIHACAQVNMMGLVGFGFSLGDRTRVCASQHDIHMHIFFSGPVVRDSSS